MCSSFDQSNAKIGVDLVKRSVAGNPGCCWELTLSEGPARASLPIRRRKRHEAPEAGRHCVDLLATQSSALIENYADEIKILREAERASLVPNLPA